MALALLLAVVLLALTAACGSETQQPQDPAEPAVTGPQEIGEIYLYGEYHANERLLQRLALWKDCYARGVRYLLWSCPITPPSTLTCGCRQRMITTLLEIFPRTGTAPLSYNEAGSPVLPRHQGGLPKNDFYRYRYRASVRGPPAHAMRHTCVPRVS